MRELSMSKTVSDESQEQPALQECHEVQSLIEAIAKSDRIVLRREKYRIALVAVDLDGTLLDQNKRVSEQTVRALQCLPASGIKVVIASARPPRSVRHIYQQLGLDTWQINYNGALIWDEPSGQVIF